MLTHDNLVFLQIIAGVSLLSSVYAFMKAYKLHAHIEKRHPGFNERMRSWCKYFRKRF